MDHMAGRQAKTGSMGDSAKDVAKQGIGSPSAAERRIGEQSVTVKGPSKELSADKQQEGFPNNR